MSSLVDKLSAEPSNLVGEGVFLKLSGVAGLVKAAPALSALIVEPVLVLLPGVVGQDLTLLVRMPFF